MHKLISYLIPLFAVLSAVAQQGSVCKDVYVLSSDSLAGRKPGTHGDSMAAQYILKAMAASGMQNNAHLLPFSLVTDVATGDKNQLSFDSYTATAGKDFSPFGFSKNGTHEAELVFAGYGFDFSTDALSVYDYKGLDVKNKWVLVIRSYPDPENEESVYAQFSRDRSKALTAADKGAAGILLVTPETMDKADEPVSLYYDKSRGDAGIPVIHVRRNIADSLLAGTGYTVNSYCRAVEKGEKPCGKNTGRLVRAAADVKFMSATTFNVYGILPSEKPAPEKKYIVIGAHYDHLGMGGYGSGSRMPDTVAVHNGADDNASGVACVLDLARRFAKDGNHTGFDLVFVAFGAEETGLTGSVNFVEKSPVPRENIRLMLNFDMVGRMKNYPAPISIGGTGTFPDAEKLLAAAVDTSAFLLKTDPDGYGPSDHASFYAAGIPVLYFNTGVHGDYHTPYDDYDKINCEGIHKISGLVYDVIRLAAGGNYSLDYTHTGAAVRKNHREGLKVTLGIMPDFSADHGKGLGVGAVTPGGPAHKGGIQKNDIITALNGKQVRNIYEYMDRLRALHPGQIVPVDILRGETHMVLLIQL
jgi:aminopeptidase YwaD